MQSVSHDSLREGRPTPGYLAPPGCRTRFPPPCETQSGPGPKTRACFGQRRLGPGAETSIRRPDLGEVSKQTGPCFGTRVYTITSASAGEGEEEEKEEEGSLTPLPPSRDTDTDISISISIDIDIHTHTGANPVRHPIPRGMAALARRPPSTAGWGGPRVTGPPSGAAR